MSDTTAGPASAPGNDEGARNKKLRNRWILAGVVVFVIAAGAVFGLPYYEYRLTHAGTNDAFIAGHQVYISSRVKGYVDKVHVSSNQVVKKGDLLVELDPKDFETAVALAKATLQAAEAGKKSAEIAFELAQATTDAALKEAEAAVAVARAGLAVSQAQVNESKSSLEQAKAQVIAARSFQEKARAQEAAAQASVVYNEKNLERIRQLVKTRTESENQLDQAVLAAKTAEAELTAAREGVKAANQDLQAALLTAAAAQDRVTQAESQSAASASVVDEALARLASARTGPKQVAAAGARVEAAAAQIAEARASLDQAELDLSYTRIRAPSAGKVTNKNVNGGQYFDVGQPMMLIVPFDVWVVANYKETDLESIRPGQPVKISVDAYPDIVFEGRVHSIQAGAGAAFSLLPPQNATGNYVKVVQRVPVKIVFDPPPDLDKYFLGPGMSVVPEIDIGVAPGRKSSAGSGGGAPRK